jgi:hypothetical protein
MAIVVAGKARIDHRPGVHLWHDLWVDRVLRVLPASGSIELRFKR